jgi:hypothetical protein
VAPQLGDPPSITVAFLGLSHDGSIRWQQSVSRPSADHALAALRDDPSRFFEATVGGLDGVARRPI